MLPMPNNDFTSKLLDLEDAIIGFLGSLLILLWA